MEVERGAPRTAAAASETQLKAVGAGGNCGELKGGGGGGEKLVQGGDGVEVVMQVSEEVKEIGLWLASFGTR